MRLLTSLVLLALTQVAAAHYGPYNQGNQGGDLGREMYFEAGRKTVAFKIVLEKTTACNLMKALDVVVLSGRNSLVVRDVTYTGVNGRPARYPLNHTCTLRGATQEIPVRDAVTYFRLEQGLRVVDILARRADGKLVSAKDLTGNGVQYGTYPSETGGHPGGVQFPPTQYPHPQYPPYPQYPQHPQHPQYPQYPEQYPDQYPTPQYPAPQYPTPQYPDQNPAPQYPDQNPAPQYPPEPPTPPQPR